MYIADGCRRKGQGSSFGVDREGLEEGDLIAGSRNSFIATLVERRTRCVMLAKVTNKDTAGVVAALTKQVQHLPSELRRSLTWDRERNWPITSA